MNRIMYRGTSGAHRHYTALNWLRGTLFAVLGAMAVSGTAADASASDLKKSATVNIEQYQVAFIGSGNLGGGTLTYKGKTHKFTIGGLGIGGFGVSKVTAHGEVYNMMELSDFEGAYGQARTGYALDDEGGGTLWLENQKGVYMKLASKRQGLALSLGADAIYIDFD